MCRTECVPCNISYSLLSAILKAPLHIAASEGHLSICKWLVEEGARVNRSDRWGGR